MIKRLVCAVVVSSAGFAANAVEYDLGTLDFAATPFKGTIVTDGSLTPFGDIFKFTLPANGGSAYSVVNFPLNIPGVVDLNVTFSAMALFGVGANGVPGGGDDGLALASGLGSNSIEMSFGPTTTSGNYYLLVQGFADGGNGGIYNGAISVSPVPEPEIWAMMLIGAGLVGFQLRRKSKQASVHRFV